MKRISNGIESLSEQYNSQSKIFVDQNFRYNGLSRQEFYRAIDVPLKDKLLLDIGCGDGFDMQTFANRGAIVYGIDSSEIFITAAKKRFRNNPNIDDYIKYSLMENIPFEDNKFDVIISKYSKQSSLDLSQVLREETRTLKKYGYLFYIVTDPVRQFLEKKKEFREKNLGPVDYYHQDNVACKFFEGKMDIIEPSHTFPEYLSPFFCEHYHLQYFNHLADFPCAEQIDGDTYPCFMIIKAQKIKT